MLNAVLTFLSREWSGLALAAALALIGLTCWVNGSSSSGVAVIAVAVAMALGSAVHLIRLSRARAANPPRGKMVDVGGCRVHVFAEGERRGRPAIVWFGGGHAAGATMDHVHRALREDTRSILIDRPGTGWSDTGPFPRTTAREADEMVAALNVAGEDGPFIFAGYSFGGLLAANIARRRPDLVATLVLLDPTPLETIVFGPRFGALREMRQDAVVTALLRLFGIPGDAAQRRAKRNPRYAEMTKAFEEKVGPALTDLRAIEVSAGSQLANYSIYRELSPEGVAACAWNTVVYDGELGDMPVVLVAPGSAEEVAANPEIAGAGAETARMIRFFAKSRERYLSTSSRSRRVVTPPGTTHQFVYERPDFVIETMREIVRDCDPLRG